MKVVRKRQFSWGRFISTLLSDSLSSVVVRSGTSLLSYPSVFHLDGRVGPEFGLGEQVAGDTVSSAAGGYVVHESRGHRELVTEVQAVIPLLTRGGTGQRAQRSDVDGCEQNDDYHREAHVCHF